MIDVRDLTFGYDSDDHPVLDSISLSIADGEFLLLAGRNGAGKTTLVRHFNGLLEPESGSVEVNGQSVLENPVRARTAVGIVFQTPRDCFVAPTVGEDVAFAPENLGLDRHAIERRVDAALETVGIADRRSDRIEHLSGGEQARVAIAGALAMDPDHIVLDEPLAGLDAPAAKALLDRLAALHDAGTSVILVTHDLRDVIDLADRVVVLSDGRIELDAPPARAIEELPAHGVRAPQ